MTHEERNNTLSIVSDQIRNAVLNKGAHYTRGEAVVAATRYIYRLYDYYNVFGEKNHQWS